MDKDFLFETNRHSDYASSTASGSDHQDKDVRAVRTESNRDVAKPTYAAVEFGSGWYHAAALNNAPKA